MRFWVVACSLLLVGEIISLILLVPPYLIAQTRMNILNDQSAGLKVQDLNKELASLTDIIKETNSYLAIFNSTSTPTGVVPALQSIIWASDKTIQLGSFFYRTNNGQQQLVVSGKAKTRQAVIDFVKKLRTQPGVVSVNLPVSDLAKANDIDFSVDVSINPQNI